MSLPETLRAEFQNILGSKAVSYSPARGGCINQGGILATAKDKFFVKWNSASMYPEMFDAEVRGLNLLHSANAIRIPYVIASGMIEDYQYLILEYISASSPQKNTWKIFGEQLAQLHKASSDKFGLGHSNYIGSLNQSNQASDSWVEFFIHQRLDKQLDLAIRNNVLDHSIQIRFEKLFKILPQLLIIEKPALLHGDLWGGNLMIDNKGNPVLIDPAVYYGNREVDLAMTMLFGGFDEGYLQSYNEVFPLFPGYKERFRIYDLYPLLVHVNLFGKSYANQLVSNLNYFVLKNG